MLLAQVSSISLSTKLMDRGIYKLSFTKSPTDNTKILPTAGIQFNLNPLTTCVSLYVQSRVMSVPEGFALVGTTSDGTIGAGNIIYQDIFYYKFLSGTLQCFV